VVFKGLVDRTTHKDIVDAVRGGALLDVFLRPRERTANVSFVDGAAAQSFLTYARRNDIYIHEKRVI
jgi:prepilin-type processing-associated H-X9-DG protein